MQDDGLVKSSSIIVVLKGVLSGDSDIRTPGLHVLRQPKRLLMTLDSLARSVSLRSLDSSGPGSRRSTYRGKPLKSSFC